MDHIFMLIFDIYSWEEILEWDNGNKIKIDDLYQLQAGVDCENCVMFDEIDGMKFYSCGQDSDCNS